MEEIDIFIYIYREREREGVRKREREREMGRQRERERVCNSAFLYAIYEVTFLFMVKVIICEVCLDKNKRFFIVNLFLPK